MTATKQTKLETLLDKHGACYEAREWASDFSTPIKAWNACQNPAWMLWALDRLGVFDEKNSRLFSCWCVRQVWHLLTDDRSKRAVEVAERFANGDETFEALSAAWSAAESAAWSAQCNKIHELWTPALKKSLAKEGK